MLGSRINDNLLIGQKALASLPEGLPHHALVWCIDIVMSGMGNPAKRFLNRTRPRLT